MCLSACERATDAFGPDLVSRAEPRPPTSARTGQTYETFWASCSPLGSCESQANENTKPSPDWPRHGSRHQRKRLYLVVSAHCNPKVGMQLRLDLEAGFSVEIGKRIHERVKKKARQERCCLHEDGKNVRQFPVWGSSPEVPPCGGGGRADMEHQR